MFVPKKALKGRHLVTVLCRRGIKRKWSRLAKEESWEETERAHTDYRAPLSQFTSVKYLGRVLVAEGYDWP